ncbi:MAG: PEP-CTERM sorting domain-containing protein [Planctomycetota bacterium]
MDGQSYTAKAFQAVQKIAKHFSKGLGIGLLATIVSLGFADKVYATYYHSEYARDAAYIDSQWYYFLDYGQYYYLDREQYNLLGELGYFLGHPFYPKLYEKELGQTIGFTNILNKGRFIFYGERVPFSGYSIRSSDNFNTGNYFHRRRNYLLGGSDYSLGRSYYQRQLETAVATAEVNTVPEPSTIAFLWLGILGTAVLKNKNRTKRVT